MGIAAEKSPDVAEIGKVSRGFTRIECADQRRNKTNIEVEFSENLREMHLFL